MLLNILLLILLVLFLAPIYWMILTALKPNALLLKMPPEWNPFKLTLENFTTILSDHKFLVFYKNTGIVAFGTTFLSMILAALASYSFSRFKFRGSSFLQLVFLSTQMFPAVALMIALYALYHKLHLLNTYTALILACATNALPLSIWVLKGFFDTIPRSLEEAASIDGCGRIQTLFQIILPLVKPGILAISIYAFLISWDDFLWGLTLVSKMELRTLAPGIALAYLGEYNYDWAKVMAASVVASLPILLVFIFLQKHMISGLVMGAVKE
ncbi:MAG TPA: carbohydrate ABC transporter permease [Firmicutes bacterium]|nr:carbohydrate ABC transporter permease [Bacillota bacterium]